VRGRIKMDINIETDVVCRLFDSEDMSRIRSSGVKVVDGELIADIGGLQKVSIVCGVTKAPFFSDIINENNGVTQEVFHKRMNTEFRKLPTKYLDQVFKKVQELNNPKSDLADLKKN
jgi:hypothetical protein